MSKFRILSLAALIAAAPAVATAQGKIDLGGKSLADLQKGVQADSNEPLTHVVVALSYWNAKRWDDVTTELNTALALDPRSAPAHLILAALPYAKNPRLWSDAASASGVPNGLAGDVATSDEHYRLAFFNDPATDIRILATVAGRMTDTTDFGKGVVACNEGRYPECNASLVQYFSSIKGSVAGVAVIPRAAYWYNAVAAMHLKDATSAAGNLSILVNRPEDDTRKLNDKDLVRVPLTSKDMEFMTGVIQYKLNNNATDALNIFQRTATDDASHYLGHVYAANLYDAQKNYEKSIAEREAALKANPNDNLLHYELGLTLAKAGKVADALPHFKTATEKMPHYAMAWYYLGLALDGTGDKAGAKAAYGNAVANATKAQAAIATNAKAKMGA